jgi:demethylmenaquinone methyltransferase / 2-methoxy-6-polyprenyl-1,4-benzoquinol methylase
MKAEGSEYDRTPMEQRGSPLGSPEEADATGRKVRQMFASVAPRYDFLNHFLSVGLDLAWRRATARELREVLERPGSSAADVCCGTGDLAFALARFSRGQVVGADFCHPMLQLASAKLRKAMAASRSGEARVRFIEADTLRLPFADGSLDAISSAFGFRNLANYELGLAEMYRVLKPGGWVAILEFSRVDWPVIGPLFRFYFRRLLPRIGTLISNVPGPYQYLPDSVARFPDQKALAEQLRQAGFSGVRYRNFAGGAAALHLGEKR